MVIRIACGKNGLKRIPDAEIKIEQRRIFKHFLKRARAYDAADGLRSSVFSPRDRCERYAQSQTQVIIESRFKEPGTPSVIDAWNIKFQGIIMVCDNSVFGVCDDRFNRCRSEKCSHIPCCLETKEMYSFLQEKVHAAPKEEIHNLQPVWRR